MNAKRKKPARWLLALGLPVLLVAALTACADWNDNPASTRTLNINVGDLAADMGYTAENFGALSQPVEGPAQSNVRTLLVGAVVIRSSATPYTDSTPITDVSDALVDDLENSAENLSFVYLEDLTGPVDTVELKLPPAGSDNWQIVAAGLNSRPGGYLDLADDAHQDAVNYFGFYPEFLQTGNDGSVLDAETGATVTDVELTMRRACLVTNPPKGCAQYDATGLISLTAAVEVLGVSAVKTDNSTVNFTQTLSGGTFPLIVRETPAAGQISVSDARLSHLDNIFTNAAYGLTIPDLSSLTVTATHQLATDASAACAAATTGADLAANCATVTYTITLQ